MGLLLACAATFLITMSIFLHQREKAVARCWHDVRGTIVEVNVKIDSAGVDTVSNSYRVPTIEYQLQNKHYRFVHQGQDIRAEWRVGDTVPLRYDPNNHLRVQLYQPSIFSTARLCALFALVLGVVSYFIWESATFRVNSEFLIGLGIILALFIRSQPQLLISQLKMTAAERLAMEPENAEEFRK